MKFLIDGHRRRVEYRREQWPEGVAGQLLTPLTRYSRGDDVYAIDNGAFTKFNEKSFISLLKREFSFRELALFVAVPDKVGCHRTTLRLYNELKDLCEGWKTAFVAQDGYDEMPSCAEALFIGGTDKFKDSQDAYHAVECAIALGKHVHIGRVNGPSRFLKFRGLGAHTCDGSGVSRYDHMILAIKEAVECSKN